MRRALPSEHGTPVGVFLPEHGDAALVGREKDVDDQAGEPLRLGREFGTVGVGLAAQHPLAHRQGRARQAQCPFGQRVHARLAARQPQADSQNSQVFYGAVTTPFLAPAPALGGTERERRS